MKRTSSFTTESDLARFYDRRPYFLIACESQLKLPTIHEKVVAFSKEHEGQRMLDGMWTLDRGFVVDFGDGRGSLKWRLKEGGECVPGWVWAESPDVLFDFFAWLSLVMPRFVRFKPVLTNYIF